jgi:hypothetical protein
MWDLNRTLNPQNNVSHEPLILKVYDFVVSRDRVCLRDVYRVELMSVCAVCGREIIFGGLRKRFLFMRLLGKVEQALLAMRVR